MNRDTGNLAIGKLHGVCAADLLYIDAGNGHVQFLRNINELARQLFVRMAGPDLGRRQPQRVHIDHGVGGGNLFLGHVSGIEVRANFALLLVRKPDEYVGMDAWFRPDRLVE